MRTLVIVVVTPSLQHQPGMRQRAEERFVQKLIAKPRVEALGESVLRRLAWLDVAPFDAPESMNVRRRTVEHPFGTLKSWMGATHFLTKGLDNVATEMSLSVLAYNLKRMMAILGVRPLIAKLAA